MSKHANGFTLIEVIVSLTMIGVVFILFSTITTFNRMSDTKSANQTDAVLAVQSLANELRATLRLNKPENVTAFTAIIDTTIDNYQNQKQDMRFSYRINELSSATFSSTCSGQAVSTPLVVYNSQQPVLLTVTSCMGESP